MDSNREDGIFAQRLIFTFWICGLIIVVALKATAWFAHGTRDIPFDPWALGGFFLAQTVFEPRDKATMASLPLIALLAYGISALLPVCFAVPYAMAIVSLGLLLGRIAFVSAAKRARTGFILLAGSIVIIGQQLANIILQFMKFEDGTFDSRAYLVDLSLGFNPIATVMHISQFMPHILEPAYSALLDYTYVTIMLMMTLVILLQLQRQSPRWLVAFVGMVLAGIIGSLLYYLFPAAGSFAAFHDFGRLPAAAELNPGVDMIDTSHVRNCMPSLHMAWALLIVMNTGGLSRSMCIASILFAVLTFLAAVVDGQHYLIDLIVAAPFAVAMQLLASGLIGRAWFATGFCVSAGVVAFWFYALIKHVEWFLRIPGFTVAATLITLLASLIIGIHAARFRLPATAS